MPEGDRTPVVSPTCAVVGGGPAGATTAGLLASWGHDVALVTRPEPTAAWLAESVPASAARLLSTVGALDLIDRADLFPNGGNTVWWAGRPERSEPFAAGRAGVHAERGTLEQVLLDGAAERGVRVFRTAPARSVERVADSWTVGWGDSTLQARWILDASGRTGVLARQTRSEDRPTGTLAVVARWRRKGGWDETDRTHTLIESYSDGWAWSVPLSNEVRCVTVMVDPRETDLERSGDLEAMLAAQLLKAPNLNERLAGAKREGDVRACPASLYTSRSFVGDHSILVGDAGSFIDPLSSYGVKKALASAWLAAVTVHTAVTNESMYRVALDFFNEREKEVYRRYRELSIPFFEEAAGVYGTPFWTGRAEAARRAAGRAEGEPAPTDTGVPLDLADSLDPSADADAMLGHREVREAYEEIRRRADVDLRIGESLAWADLPLVRDRLVVLDTHLTSASVETGVRYVRNVDLARLVDVAPAHRQVPDIFEAYNRGAAPAELPDFLAALALAVGKGFLQLADWRPTAWSRTLSG